MKTAKEWIDWHGTSDHECVGVDICLIEEDLKEIQLDAWKQGMTDAAEMAKQWFNKDIILKACDNKTEL